MTLIDLLQKAIENKHQVIKNEVTFTIQQIDKSPLFNQDKSRKTALKVVRESIMKKLARNFINIKSEAKQIATHEDVTYVTETITKQD